MLEPGRVAIAITLIDKRIGTTYLASSLILSKFNLCSAPIGKASLLDAVLKLVL